MADTIPDVTLEDVDARYDGDLTTEFDEEYVTTQIADAVDYALSRWRDKITARLASGALTDNLYKRTIANAVLRVLRNPDGYASENELGYGYTQRANVASGYLGFTQDDLDNLIGVVGPAVAGTVGIGLDRGWR